MKGRMRLDPSVCVEVSDERILMRPTLLKSDLSYVGLWRGPDTLFEFQAGQVVHLPQSDATLQLVASLLP